MTEFQNKNIFIIHKLNTVYICFYKSLAFWKNLKEIDMAK